MPRRWLLIAVTVAFVLAGAVVAVASPSSAPVLKSPHNGGRVRSGNFSLVVNDPGVPRNLSPVYVTISNRRRLDKYGHLAVRFKCNGLCDFIGLHPWRGHPGYWIVKAPPGFRPWWSETSGKYYWQASHTAPMCLAKGCVVVSAIHTFRVVP